MDPVKNLPVAVIGAGPIGLAAAAHLLERGLEPLIFEAGPTAGWAIGQWRHIRLFSPWRFNLDAAAVRLLDTLSVEDLPLDSLVERELCLVKVAYSSENRAELMDIAKIFRAQVEKLGGSLRE